MFRKVLFSFTGLCMLFLAGKALAYDPPLGIPAPDFGIDETAPAQPGAWPGAEAAGFYYVDNTHPAATDSGNSYGYPDKPRATIPEITYAAGSYVEVHGGPYADTNIQLRFDCTQAQPCWLRGTPASKPVITGQFRIFDAHYVIFENLDFNGGGGAAMGIGGMSGDHIAIRHSNVRNRAFAGNTSGIGIQPNLGGTMNDIVVYKNLFHALGDWQTSADEDFHGVAPNLWGRDATTSLSKVWILDNEFHHISGNGVQVIAGNWTDSHKYLHHVYVGRNVGHTNRQTAFWSKQASDVIFSQNTAYGGRRHGTQPGDGIGFQYGPDNIWIIFNTIYDSNFGIRQSSTNTTPGHKAYIIGNLIYDIHPEAGYDYVPTDPARPGVALALWQGGMDRYVVDNTIHDVRGGVSSVQRGGLFMSGNIISDIGTDDFHMSIYNSWDVTTADKLMFHEPGGTARFRWRSTTYDTLAKFQSVSGLCANCVTADPLFKSAATRDYHLQGGSPARDVGVQSDVYDVFFARYGINIRVDHDGAPRPRGSAFDYGALEALSADFNADGVVDSLDLGILMSFWNQVEPSVDLNNDGTVDEADLDIALGDMGL